MYVVNLRIPVRQYLPVDLQEKAGRAFVNVAALSPRRRTRGERVILSENCRDAEVVECGVTARRDFDFLLEG